MTNELALTDEQEETTTQLANTPDVMNNKPPPDAKALRTEAVGALLSGAYAGASTLKLKPDEVKRLTADFPDEMVEIRPFDGLIYIPHMQLRERFWDVFGPTEVAEICRERFMRPDSNEIAVDLVLMVRGKFVAEGVGTAKYYPNNAKGSFGDTVESAWSEALRRCAKKLGVGTAVWRPDYVRRWIADNAVEKGGKWYRKDDPRIASAPKAKGRDYTLTDSKPVSEFQKMKAAVQAVPETDDEGVPFLAMSLDDEITDEEMDARRGASQPWCSKCEHYEEDCTCNEDVDEMDREHVKRMVAFAKRMED